MDMLKKMLDAYRAGDRNFPTYKELEVVAADIARLEQALAGRQVTIGGLNAELAKCGVHADRLRAAILALPCTPPKGYGTMLAGVAAEIYGAALKAAADLVGQLGGAAQPGPTIASWPTGDPLPGIECEICDDTGRTFGKVCACGGGK